MSRQTRVFHLLQLAHSALFRTADHRLRVQAGISASQLGVLFVLANSDGLPITAIADALNMGYSSLTGLVDRMSRRQLVRRESSTEDGRVQRVFIEPAGRETAERALLSVKRINAELLKPFSSTERRAIERFLIHVSENAAAIVAAGNPYDEAAAGQKNRRKES